jgi:hypothetical protein
MRGGEGTWCYDTFRMVYHSSRDYNRSVPILSTGRGYRLFTPREFPWLRRGASWPGNNTYTTLTAGTFLPLLLHDA